MAGGVDTRVVEAVERATARIATVDELFEVVGHEVAKAVPFDASMWFGIDPATMLAVSPSRIENLDSGFCDIFWHGEFHEHDVALYRDLARASVPAASLHGATDGRPLRSARYRDFLEPQGYDDELRALFRAGESTWAVVGLFREKGSVPFSGEDVALLAALSSVVGSAYRTMAAVVSPSTGLSSSPGLLLFGPDNVLLSANAEATRWLGDLYGDGEAAWLELLADPAGDDLDVPITIIPLLARARAVASGYEDRPARLRIRDRSGRWVVLHASTLEGSGGHGGVAVVIEPAKSAEIAPIIIEAYGLSPRERDVVRAIARGASTPEIATELFLSAHTVRDYIKSVFEKVGVNSRGELVAKLFAEHYSDALHETLVHVG